MTDIKNAKNAKKFYCEKCTFICSKKSNYDKHLMTPKHKNTDKILTNTDVKNASVTNVFICECGNNYKHRQSLFNHKKKCHLLIINKLDNIDMTDSNILVQLIKQNDEFKNLLLEQSKAMIEQGNTIMELSKNSSNTNISNNHIISNNKTFNLQFFLNETCKNALNIDDFVSSIKVSLSELENTGRRGYIEGISSIIINKLNNLSHCDRPLHCSDHKRETMYIKNDNQWIKETEENPILKRAIKTIANENIKQINTWRQQNPDCTDSDSKKNNFYLKMVINSMSGSTKEESDKNYEKIISNVAKQVTIDK